MRHSRPLGRFFLSVRILTTDIAQDACCIVPMQGDIAPEVTNEQVFRVSPIIRVYYDFLVIDPPSFCLMTSMNTRKDPVSTFRLKRSRRGHIQPVKMSSSNSLTVRVARPKCSCKNNVSSETSFMITSTMAPPSAFCHCSRVHLENERCGQLTGSNETRVSPVHNEQP